MKNFLSNEIARLREAGLFRTLRSVGSSDDAEITMDGRRVLNFCSNNYLGLADDERVVAGAIGALRRYGAGSGAARLISGNFEIFEELESELARFKGTEAALLFNSGYHANIGVIPALAGEGDVIFSDELNHASLIDGCRLSRADKVVYRHNDVNNLEDLLRKSPLPRGERAVRKWIISEAVFSMEGDVCPLEDLIALAEKHDAIIYLDEAHAVGVLGAKGNGLLEAPHPRVISMGTLGKALGSYGAFVAGSQELRDYLINKARSFIFSTAMPPSAAGAALAALKIVRNEPERLAQLRKNIKLLGSGGARSCFWRPLAGRQNRFEAPGPDPSAIFSILIGDAKKTMALSKKLFDEGIYLQGIRPPTVPEGTSRLRLTVMALHSHDQIQQLLKGLEWVPKN